MRKLTGLLLTLLLFFMNSCIAFAIQEVGAKNVKTPVYKPNARTIKYAFVFDGPSDKNQQVLKQFQSTITKSTAPDYKAEFPSDMVFVGNWTKDSVKSASDKAINSNATMVISLGYLTSKYYNDNKDKKKFVVTIDQYGLRDFGEGFFNPVQQSVKGVYAFKKLLNFNKTAILMNENYYKTRKDWNKFVAPKLKDVDFVIVPATQDIDKTFAAIPKDCDAVVLTPLFNLSTEERKHLIRHLNEQKIPTFSTLGKEDVELGALLGSGAYDLDRKIAETTSFNIKGALKGEVKNLYLTGNAPIAQLIDAQQLYLDSQLAAMNSQNQFFKQLVWVQRALCSVNWASADEDSQKFIQSVKDKLERKGDIAL